MFTSCVILVSFRILSINLHILSHLLWVRRNNMHRHLNWEYLNDLGLAINHLWRDMTWLQLETRNGIATGSWLLIEISSKWIFELINTWLQNIFFITNQIQYYKSYWIFIYETNTFISISVIIFYINPLYIMFQYNDICYSFHLWIGFFSRTVYNLVIRMK